MNRQFIVLLLSGCGFTTAAFAQEAAGNEAGVTRLDQIIITAGRNESSIAAVAQSVQVIDREQVEEAMRISPNASDLISRLVPGFAPSNQTISGASETFRGRSVLIMVDGVPRNTPLRDLSRILSMIDLNSVERIEVVNGASSLYGAGGTGGTINFITKRGTSDKPTITVRTGLSGYTENLGKSTAPETSIAIEGRKDKLDYYFSGTGDWTRRTYDGHGNEMPSDAMLGQGGGDRMVNGNFFGVVGYESGPRRFEVSFDWTYAKQKPEWFTDYTTNPVSPKFGSAYTGEPLREDSKYLTAKYTDQDFALGNLEVKAFYNKIFKQSPFTELSAVNTQVYYSGNARQPTAWFNQSKYDFDRTGVNMTITTPMDFITNGSKLTWGVDYAYDKVAQTLLNDEDAIAPMTQNSIAAFAQAEIPVTERFRLQGGARFDQFYLDVNDFTRPTAVAWPARSLANIYPAISVLGGSFDYNAWTFNAGAVYDVTEEVQAFGNFSQGYSLTDIGAFTRRAGVNSLAEICDAYGSIAAIYGCSGTPDYTISYADIAPKPQLVNTYEVGLRGDWGDLRSTVSSYISTSKDGVNYDIAANRVSQQKERIWGVEARADYDINSMFTIGGLVAYQEGKYDANGDGSIGSDEYLPNNRIPTTWKGLAYTTVSFEGGYKVRGEVEYFSGRDRIKEQEIEDATLVNMAFSKTFENGSEASLAVRNVFDTYYINPTATATRNAPVAGLGRSVFLSYKVTF
ncbi:TonB-dependent receptor [Brucella pituitosa]|uniref:TonB-dependent receptor n=1 Tax=Brucella pituitosa TaxID=571256 RepID=UPI003F4AAB47